MTEKNLKPGWKDPEAQRRGTEAAKRRRAEEAAITEKAKDDPYRAFADIHLLMTLHILDLLKREKDGPPSREVTNRLREYRQLTDTLAEYLREQGEAEWAERFFKAVEDFLAEREAAGALPAGLRAEA